MAISEDIIHSIKDRVSISTVVSEYVQLKQSGRNYVGLCPFHTEKSPSFFVREEEASFHCFGCGKKGSVFQFIMDMKGLSFPEAVRYLGKQVGIPVPDSFHSASADGTYQSQHLKNLRLIIEAAAREYESQLRDSRKAREYLAERGLDPHVQARFRLGYAPKGWDFILSALNERVQSAESSAMEHLRNAPLRDALVELGLLKVKKNESVAAERDSSDGMKTSDAEKFEGVLKDTPIEVDEAGSVQKTNKERVYDAFRDRVIFPITRSDGLVIAFGGRIMEKSADQPKYINSCESPLYLKRKALYGLSQALASLRKERHLYLVEGYMDVLGLVQAGIPETVATCGTAVTPQHAEVMKRLVDRVTVVFDGDEAGRRAAAHCFQSFLNTGLDVDVVLLPDGHDPDSASRAMRPEQLRALLERETKPMVEIFLERLLQEEGAGSELSPAGSGRIAEKFSALVAQVKNPVEREFLLKKGAHRLGTSLEALDAILRDESRKLATRSASSSSSLSKKRESLGPAPNYFETTSARSEVPFPDRSARDQASRPQARFSGSRPKSQKRDQLSSLYRQLLVAVLCEPSLAKTVLDSPSLFEIQPEDSEKRKKLPSQIQAFLVAMSESQLLGVHSIVAKVKEEGLRSGNVTLEVLPELKALLEAHGFEAAGLLTEALRQTQVGGSEPEKIVNESVKASAHWVAKQQVEVIRGQERQADDEERLLLLAQEKLQRRRYIEKLRNN